MEYYVAAFVLLLCMALGLLILSRKAQKASGLPAGKMLYSDTGAWRRVEKPYFDPAWGLAGKPDYVIDTREGRIPVEVKSTTANSLYDSHIIQLAAYCRLVEVNSGQRPPLGLIKYRNRVFEVEYTDELESKLETLIHEIRSSDPWQDVPRSHQSRARCAGCGYAEGCPQRLDSSRPAAAK